MNMENMNQDILQRLTETLEARKQASPESSYVAKLFSKGEDAILKKIGEEATEMILASKGGDRTHLVYETADLWFHCMVLLAKHGLSADDVLNELARREGLSGIAEKESRKKD
jgi:phosphoribosyl-ATP pyrophosphohydrolase